MLRQARTAGYETNLPHVRGVRTCVLQLCESDLLIITSLRSNLGFQCSITRTGKYSVQAQFSGEKFVLRMVGSS